MASTAVASRITRPAPDIANEPRCIQCQGCATPSSAAYWHIGETTMRLGNSKAASLNGVNRTGFIAGLLGRLDQMDCAGRAQPRSLAHSIVLVRPGHWLQKGHDPIVGP